MGDHDSDARVQGVTCWQYQNNRWRWMQQSHLHSMQTGAVGNEEGVANTSAYSVKRETMAQRFLSIQGK